MKYPRFPVLLCVLLGLGLMACGTGNPDPAVKPESGPAFPGRPGPGLPAPAELARIDSDASEFLIQQPGAGFAADLHFQGCTVNGELADFSAAAMPNKGALADTAHCIYRLSYDPLASLVQLTLDWSAAPAGACWIGLSDWASDSWHWQRLPEGGVLELADAQRYSDIAQHCYVAVVVSGEGPCSLTTIGFGDPPPPPPSSEGYTLICPLFDTNTYLIDMDGNVVHNWTSNYTAGATAVLLEDGHLLRGANVPNGSFGAGGRSGRIEEYSWEGSLLWSYHHSTSQETTHHDFRRLPNGNILFVLWYYVSDGEIIAHGRNPELLTPGTFLADAIIEVQPTLPSGGTIVWRWNAIDHLIQDYDAQVGNFGDPAQHPELIDINFPPGSAGDWTHLNAVDYNPELDQIMVTSPHFSEIWIIDHSTTTEQAATHSGGRSGRGGDILYRWGNPQAYQAGDNDTQQLNFCHNGHWIEPGLEGAGDILIFDNQPSPGEQGDAYSSTVQIMPPLNPDGSYNLDAPAFGPQVPSWQFVGDPPSSFYSPIMSGIQRLPGGGNLICAATSGYIFEIDTDKKIVWDYQTTLGASGTTFVFRALRYTYDYPGVANLLIP